MQIGIFGLGLEGAGLGMELRAVLARNVTVTGFDHDRDRKAQAAGAVDHSAPDIATLAEASTIFVAVEVDLLEDALRALRPHLKPGTVISEIGAVKAPGIDIAADVLPAGGLLRRKSPDRTHPGPAAGIHDEGRVWCLIPGRGATAEAMATLNELALALDYRPLIMTPDEHDMYVGATRHLPVVARAALLSMIAGSEGWQDLAPFAADLQPSSAATGTSAPAEFIANRKAINHWLDRFQARLAEINSQISAGDEEAVSDMLDDSAVHEARIASSRDRSDDSPFSRRVVEGLFGTKFSGAKSTTVTGTSNPVDVLITGGHGRRRRARRGRAISRFRMGRSWLSMDLSGSSDAVQTVDATGSLVLPGLVDGHFHCAAASASPVADDMRQGTISAIHGGVTTVLVHVFGNRGQPLLEALAAFAAASGAQSVIDFGMHCGVRPEQDLIEQIPDVVAAGSRSFKFHLDYRKTGDGRMFDTDLLLAGMEQIASIGAVAIVHAEDGHVIDYLENKLSNSGESTPASFLGHASLHSRGDGNRTRLPRSAG